MRRYTMIKKNLIDKLEKLNEEERELAMILIDAIDKDRTSQTIEDALIDKINELIVKGV